MVKKLITIISVSCFILISCLLVAWSTNEEYKHGEPKELTGKITFLIRDDVVSEIGIVTTSESINWVSGSKDTFNYFWNYPNEQFEGFNEGDEVKVIYAWGNCSSRPVIKNGEISTTLDIWATVINDNRYNMSCIYVYSITKVDTI